MLQEEIERALRMLAARLSARGVNGEVMLVGGAAMCLAYAARAMTRDVDAVFEPKTVILDEARRVAEELGLAPDWLNDGAKGFVSEVRPSERRVVISVPGLLVWAPDPAYIFAMKCLAARVEDRSDMETLGPFSAWTVRMRRSPSCCAATPRSASCPRPASSLANCLRPVPSPTLRLGPPGS